MSGPRRMPTVGPEGLLRESPLLIIPHLRLACQFDGTARRHTDAQMQATGSYWCALGVGAFEKLVLAGFGRDDRSVLRRDVDGAGDFDVEFFGVVALVDGNADAAARIDVEERVADGDVHEGFAVRQGNGLFVDLDGDFVADDVAELHEIVARDVGDERAE